MSDEPQSRAIIRSARRVLIKAGTSVVANEDGHPSLTRLGAIAEQIGELVRSGVEVIFVSSGAVGMGKRLLRTQNNMQLSFSQLQRNKSGDKLSNEFIEEEEVEHVVHHRRSLRHGSTVKKDHALSRDSSFLNLFEAGVKANMKKTYDSACAAAGQFEMMNLYSNLFSQADVTLSQLLLTQIDFQDSQRLANLSYTVERLLSLGIVPIINENDAVSGNMGYVVNEKLTFSDNDGLANLCARHFDCEVILLLTDVDGVYDRPPTQAGAKKLAVYNVSDEIEVGSKSKHILASVLDCRVSSR